MKLSKLSLNPRHSLKNNFKCFVSYSSQDENQVSIVDAILSGVSSDILILDVNGKTDKKMNMGRTVLSYIDQCDLFVCIVTPTSVKVENPSCIEGGGDAYMLTINNNVMIELGYAMNRVKNGEIQLFVESGTEKDFKRIKPSLIEGDEYKTYINSECIIQYIQNERDSFYENDCHCCYDGVKKYVLQDTACISRIKYEFFEELNILPTYDVYKVFEKYLKQYELYEITHMCVLHIQENYGLLDTTINDCFFNLLIPSLLSPSNKWFSYSRNKFIILEMYQHLKYILFQKYGNCNDNDVKNNRMGFVLSLRELLTGRHWLKEDFKNEAKRLISESVECDINVDYVTYVYLLEHDTRKDNSNISTSYLKYIIDIENSKNGYNKTYLGQTSPTSLRRTENSKSKERPKQTQNSLEKSKQRQES